jgi:hypothetical protein
MAIASQSSWIGYTSKTYKFTIKHPTDWVVSETRNADWAMIFDRENSYLAVTWRTIPRGTTLSAVTQEVWKKMTDTGYSVVSSTASMIDGLPAQILVVNGVAAGQQRHGVVGIAANATGRYRIELWSRPGSEANDLTLFNAFAQTFSAG